MVRAPGAHSRARDAGEGARADESPRLLARQSQPRAGADRRVHRQSDAVQSPRRGRLWTARRGGGLSRPDQSADLSAAFDRDAVVAVARGGPPRPCGSDAEAHRRPTLAVAGCARHRDPEFGLRTGVGGRLTLRAPHFGSDVAASDRLMPTADSLTAPV